jgi:SAM-dependent methyltransferase
MTIMRQITPVAVIGQFEGEGGCSSSKVKDPQNNKPMTKGTTMNGWGSVSRKIHPFPARMAPEIALRGLRFLPEGGTVLDPMCGSGTVLYEALHQGHRAIGFDVDPLAVLISRVSTRPVDTTRLSEAGNAIADHAVELQRTILHIPWIDGDEETLKFTKFWFARKQRCALRSLVWLVMRIRGPVGDALRLAISKIIVTKEPCASLARDTSHSRPHRVTLINDYDVIQGFRRAVTQIVGELNRNPTTYPAVVRLGDARRLPFWLTGRADLVVTSPPYGNAIDYLRGHRMALVWLGYSISKLREMRRRSGGTGSGLAITHFIKQERVSSIKKFGRFIIIFLVGPVSLVALVRLRIRQKPKAES